MYEYCRLHSDWFSGFYSHLYTEDVYTNHTIVLAYYAVSDLRPAIVLTIMESTSRLAYDLRPTHHVLYDFMLRCYCCKVRHVLSPIICLLIHVDADFVS